MLVKSYDKLPTRLKISPTSPSFYKSDFICAIKTAFRPKYHIPYIWIIVTKNNLLLCNTHKTKGIWALYYYNKLYNVQLEKDIAGGLSIEILEMNLDNPTIKLPMPLNTNAEEANELIMHCRNLIR
jgi:hypothetical protein